MNEEGERMLVAKGGEGGSPKTDYRGQPGSSNRIYLDLKLIADVGLVG